MFTVKATYRGETRKITFPDSYLFPSFEQLSNQLYRIFPISNNYFLSKLLFSPDSSSSRILISREVHNAEEYNKCIASLSRRHFPNPLLRFAVLEENSHKIPGSFHQDQTIAAFENESFGTPASSSDKLSFPNISMSGIPPPPIIFSSSPMGAPLPAMDVDTPAPPPPPKSFNLSAAAQLGEAQSTAVGDGGKADVEQLIAKFKEDLDSILKQTFGPKALSPPTPPPVPPMPFFVPPPPPPPIPHRVQPSFEEYPQGSRWLHPGSTNLPNLAPAPQPWIQRDWRCSLPTVAPTAPLPPLPPLPVPTAFMSPAVSEASPSPRPATPPTPVVHQGILCDACNEVPIGIRHKCLDCPDYDLCTACIDSGAAEDHNPFHEFFELIEPGRVVVHTVADRRPESNPGANTRRGSTMEHPAVPAPAVHQASCNLCDSRIIGDRMKCLECPDFDSCTSCFRCVKEQHPGHGFVRVKTQSDYVRGNTAPRERQMHFATCNACGKGIYGVRYKCMHPNCHDYDLCEDCEAHPIPVHPDNHPLLKMKDANTLIPSVYRIGQDIRPNVRSLPSPPPVHSPAGSFGRGFMLNPNQAFPHDTPAPPPFFYGTPEVHSPVPLASPTRCHPEPIHDFFTSRSPSPTMNIPGALPRRIEPRYSFIRAPVAPIPPLPYVTPFTPLYSRSPSPVRQRSPSPSCSRFGAHSNPFGPPTRTPSPWTAYPQYHETTQPLARAVHVKPEDDPLDASTESLAPQLQLPPLSLGSTGPPFSLWPRAADLLNLIDPSVQSLRDSITTVFNAPVDPSSSGQNILGPRDSTVTSPLQELSAKNIHPIEESPLTGAEALLSRPDSSDDGRQMSQSNSFPVTSSRLHSLAALLGGRDSPSPLPSSAAVSVCTFEPASEMEPPALEVTAPSARFINDVTVPDGQVLPPGAEFMKCWKMENDSGKSWPENTELVFVAGEPMSRHTSLSHSVKIGPVMAGEKVNIWTGDLKAPEVPGRYVSYWRLHDGKEVFGDNIWLDIIVADAGQRDSDDSKESSMTSSSVIIMPQMNARASPSITTTAVTADDAVSDAGSEASSISLISLPASSSSSEDDMDDAVWQDSRSSMHITRTDVEPGEEYVVLYESSSDEE